MIICSHLGLGPPDGAWLDGAGLIEPGEDLGHAAVGDQQLPRDVARAHLRLGIVCTEIAGNIHVPTDPHERQLHDPPPHVVGERPPVDEDSAQLVDPRLAWSKM